MPTGARNPSPLTGSAALDGAAFIWTGTPSCCTESRRYGALGDGHGFKAMEASRQVDVRFPRAALAVLHGALHRQVAGGRKGLPVKLCGRQARPRAVPAQVVLADLPLEPV
jgi:hypothetical protein